MWTQLEGSLGEGITLFEVALSYPGKLRPNVNVGRPMCMYTTQTIQIVINCHSWDTFKAMASSRKRKHDPESEEEEGEMMDDSDVEAGPPRSGSESQSESDSDRKKKRRSKKSKKSSKKKKKKHRDDSSGKWSDWNHPDNGMEIRISCFCFREASVKSETIPTTRLWWRRSGRWRRRKGWRHW